jgi:thiol-disulfide isomerase/thioredoxin
MNLLNQYSYVLIAVIVCVILYAVLRRFAKSTRPGAMGAVLLAAAIFIGGFALLQTGEGDVSDVPQFEALIANDRPTFIEFFSNYCTGCLLLRPTVDGIVADIGDRFNVVRINIHSTAGRELREDYGFSFTPEFVLLDAAGQEVWRDHVPPSDADLQRAIR